MKRAVAEKVGDIIFRGVPGPRAHGDSIVFSVGYGTLVCEIFKGLRVVGCVKVFVILSVGAFNLTVVPRCIRADQLVFYP